jgi:hypothetical protein
MTITPLPLHAGHFPLVSLDLRFLDDIFSFSRVHNQFFFSSSLHERQVHCTLKPSIRLKSIFGGTTSHLAG